jgi:hypothetical protein
MQEQVAQDWQGGDYQQGSDNQTARSNFCATFTEKLGSNPNNDEENGSED